MELFLDNKETPLVISNIEDRTSFTRKGIEPIWIECTQNKESFYRELLIGVFEIPSNNILIDYDLIKVGHWFEK